MRKTTDTPNFPYNLGTVCYISVDGQGNVKQLLNNITMLSEAYQEAVAGRAKLYAVWPGQWRSDLFLIDDLATFADKVGIKRDDSAGLPDTQYKELPKTSSRSRTVPVEVTFEGELSALDLLCDKGFLTIARQLEDRYGWEVAKSSAYYSGSTGNSFVLHVHEHSLK